MDSIFKLGLLLPLKPTSGSDSTPTSEILVTINYLKKLNINKLGSLKKITNYYYKYYYFSPFVFFILNFFATYNY